MQQNSGIKHKYKGWIILDAVIFFVAAVLCYLYYYLRIHFERIKAAELLFYMNTDTKEANWGAFRGALRYTLLIGFSVVLLCVAFYLKQDGEQKQKRYVHGALIAGILATVLACGLIVHQVELVRFLKTYKVDSPFIEEQYVDPAGVDVTFPETKRNLIFLYLESMETTFSDQAHGGALDYDIIPEITEISCKNVNFSGNDDEVLNGCNPAFGTTFTIGAMVGTTAGLPLKRDVLDGELFRSTWDEEVTTDYLPGVRTLGDILKENGYRQELMVGSIGNFSGRDIYFQNHGDFVVKDLLAMREEERLSRLYHVFWGFEDQKLFQFAKEDISELAKRGEPFNFTFLTVDTHYPDGYTCEICEKKFKKPYSNVYACSSSQTADFVHWVMEQDFYDNTTIVIMGDHPTMNSDYLRWEIPPSYIRRSYLAIVNPAPGLDEGDKARCFTAFDMFPTTLAAMGCRIEGERLGLGVNLFSDMPTLAEEYGLQELDTSLMMNSPFYNEMSYEPD